MKNVVQTTGFVIAALVPVILIWRWRFLGLLVSVLTGWLGIHLCNIAFPYQEPVEAVFIGVWVALGWLYMLVWCSIVYGVVYLVRKRKHRHV